MGQTKETTTSSLLSREAFRQAVFDRDRYQCVFCDRPAVDAHHILERKLWPDGGYYLDNGAAVCEVHHLLCEKTAISVETIRQACGITRILLPPHFEADQAYDKWGNPVLLNGQRLKGELFDNPGAQKMLAKVLHLFTSWVKYPRTFHLPWSLGLSDDDKVIKSLDPFLGQRVIVSEKKDGQNSSLYRAGLHARSIDGRHHPSQDWIKQFHAQIRHDIPENLRICGENLYARHSIPYLALPSYFLGVSVWEKNICLSWDETLGWFALLGITPVPVLYDGPFDEQVVRDLWVGQDPEKIEGYVVRVADSFSYGEFRKKVAKFVRAGHVQTSKHWATQEIVKNSLRKKN